MIRQLHRYCLLPAFESVVKRRPTLRYWTQLEQSQWESTDRLQALQLDKLRRLLEHAVTHCPYYCSQWLTHGLQPAMLSDLSDFRSWPLIDRDTIRANRQSMRSTCHGTRLIHKATGGSSGVPLQFDLDTGSYDRRMAMWHRGYGWAGAGPGTKQLYLWGVPLNKLTRKQAWKDSLYNWLYRRSVVSSFGFRDELAGTIARQLARCKPDAIVAYTSPLYFLARALKEQGIAPYSPRSIVVGAEKLHRFQRELIEEVFGCPLFETYGSREFMLIGAECELHAGLHLSMEHLLVEITDDEGNPVPDGAEGNVVITDLHNYGMPFIRYVTGDRAIAGFTKCSCGRGLPMLRQVVGRQLDVLSTPDGRRLPGEYFPHLLKDYPGVRRFQVIQEAPDLVRLLLVVGDGWSTSGGAELLQVIRGALGPAVQLHTDFVDEIPLTLSGKLQVVVNRCATGQPPVEVATG